MDIETLMAQAQALQSRVADAQAQLDKMMVKGIAENGACIIDMTGKYDVKQVTIRPDILASGAPAVEEAVLSALRDAKAKADVQIDKVMGDATSGVSLP